MGKIAEATTNKGGGKAGLEDRLGGKGGHAKFQCHIVSIRATSLATHMYIYAVSDPSISVRMIVQDAGSLHQIDAGSS